MVLYFVYDVNNNNNLTTIN